MIKLDKVNRNHEKSFFTKDIFFTFSTFVLLMRTHVQYSTKLRQILTFFHRPMIVNGKFFIDKMKKPVLSNGYYLITYNPC